MSSPSNRRAHLVAVERLAFDLARFHNLFGQRVENRFRSQLKAEALDVADETALPVPHVDETRGYARVIPAELRPSGALVDVGPCSFSPHHMRRI
jgi:hypothetical protein